MERITLKSKPETSNAGASTSSRSTLRVPRFAGSRSGFSLIEALIGAAIISVALLSLVSVSGRLSRISTHSKLQTKAAYLIEEGMEVSRLIRDGSWTSFSALTPGVPYHLYFSAGTWSATTAPQLISGGFSRTVVHGTVSRDANSTIVATGGTVDGETKKVTVAVSWLEKGATSTIQAVTYLAKIF